MYPPRIAAPQVAYLYLTSALGAMVRAVESANRALCQIPINCSFLAQEDGTIRACRRSSM